MKYRPNVEYSPDMIAVIGKDESPELAEDKAQSQLQELYRRLPIDMTIEILLSDMISGKEWVKENRYWVDSSGYVEKLMYTVKYLCRAVKCSAR